MQISDDVVRVAAEVLAERNHGSAREWETSARAALSAALAAMWKPIEEAPKDGSRILAGHFDQVNGDFRQFVCFWNPGWKGMEGARDSGPFWQAGGLLEHPTHWTDLLPSPPSTNKEDGE